MLSLKHPKNEWDYKLNINHPDIIGWYKFFKKQIGESLYPISDTERIKFECLMRQAYKRYGDNAEARSFWLACVIEKVKPLNNESVKKYKDNKAKTWLEVLKVLNKKSSVPKATEPKYN